MAVILATILLLLHVHAVSNAWTDFDSVCPVPLTPSYTSMSGCSYPYTHWEICSYSCLSGYIRVSGSITRTCSSDGSWTGTNLVCTRVPTGCSSAPTLANTHRRGCYFPYTHGETCTYSCRPGYTQVSGSTTRTCYNGRWNGNNLVCRRGQDMERSTTTIIMPGATCSFGKTTEQLTSTFSTKPEATSNIENPQVPSTPRPVLPTKAETTLGISVDTTAATSDAVPTNSPSTESPVIATENVSLTLTAPSSVNLSLLRDSIMQVLETQICGDQCTIGAIFLHKVPDANLTRKKRQAGDEVQINVTIQLIVLASPEGISDKQMAKSLLLERAAMLKELALNGDLSVNNDGKLVRRVDSSGAKQKTPPWLIGVVCAAVVVIIVIVLVAVLLCRKKHKPGANMPTKNGNEMTNLDTPKRLDHPATDGSVDNIIYNTEDEGVVNNVIYNAGDDGTVDNVIYEGQDSQTNDRENAPESQYETIN